MIRATHSPNWGGPLPFAESEAVTLLTSINTQNVIPASSMLSLLKSDDLAIKSEDEVFDTVVAWLNAVHAARMRAPACAVPARRV